MRALFFGLLLALVAFGKDNFIFDYQANKAMNDRIERLEREIGQLKGQSANLQNERDDLARRNAAAGEKTNMLLAQIERLQGEIAAQNARIAGIARQKTTIVMSAPEPSQKTSSKAKTPPRNTIVQGIGDDVAGRLDNIENDINGLKSAVRALADKIAHTPKNAGTDGETQEVDPMLEMKVADIESRLDSFVKLLKTGGVMSGMPFEEYFSFTKQHLEYFILGLLGFILLLFLMVVAALGRAGRAEGKITQLVKLYQSSSRKFEDRK
ncbi:MAG: hypothetical protein LBU73_03910 [Helicobacteraceae bacterium]|jgi:uncharacterized protein (UPF0335 family)|nr:hypothetical protein [Helicobacteraceae bacterium]